MRSLLVVVADELLENRSQMPLVEHDQMVEALPTQCPDHSLRDSVRLGRVDWGGDSVDADALGPSTEVAAVEGIAIPQQMSWCASRASPRSLVATPRQRSDWV